MSEAELHILKSRLQQGMWNKAQRGEVLNHPPIGYVRTLAGDFVIDPDEQVRAVVHLIFEQFGRRGSVSGLLRWLVHHKVNLPIRPHFGPNRGELEWRRPNRVTLLNLLHHPIYAEQLRYSCQREAIDYGMDACQSLSGAVLESFVVEQMLQAVSPASLALSLAAAADIEHERKQLDNHWRQRLARSRHEVEQARRQYAAVDPDHRLVARELERRWDEALRAEEQLHAEYARFQRDCPQQLSPQSNYDELVARIHALRAECQTLSEVAATLNAEGFRPPKRSQAFTEAILSRFLRDRGVRTGPRPRSVTEEQHLQANERWLADLAADLGMPIATLHRWQRVGWLVSRKVESAGGRWAIYADAAELLRLRQLRDTPRGWPRPYPEELTTPTPQTPSNC